MSTRHSHLNRTTLKNSCAAIAGGTHSESLKTDCTNLTLNKVEYDTGVIESGQQVISKPTRPSTTTAARSGAVKPHISVDLSQLRRNVLDLRNK